MARTFADVAGFVGVPVEELQTLTWQQRAYLIETFIQVEHPMTGTPVPLVPNPMQEHILKTLDARELTVKWRRAGLTSIYCASAWINLLTRPGWKVELFAHDWSTATEIFDQVILYQYEHLPREIRPKYSHLSSHSIQFDDLGSHFKVGTAGQSEEVAQKKGQARTINELICTEFAFYAYAEKFIQKIENCVPLNGVIHIDSTPNGQNSFYKRFKRGMRDEGSFRTRFYPWWWGANCTMPLEPGESADDLYGMGPITDEEKSLGEGNPFANEDTGKDRLTLEQIKWRRWKIDNTEPLGAATPEDRFRVEFPEDPQSCFLASGRPVLSSRDVVARTKLRGPIEGHRHVIGHDASTGDASGHPCGISIIDVSCSPAEQVYEERAWIPIEAQAARLIELQREYPGIIIPERNGPGLAVITALKAAGAKNVYRHRIKDLKDGPRKATQRKPGFPMSSVTKPLIFEELRRALHARLGEEPELLLAGPITIEELKAFQYDDNDLITFEEERIADGSVIHGDVGIATCLAWQARKITLSGIA